jgi:hypothetical protein
MCHQNINNIWFHDDTLVFLVLQQTPHATNKRSVVVRIWKKRVAAIALRLWNLRVAQDFPALFNLFIPVNVTELLIVRVFFCIPPTKIPRNVTRR